MTRGALIALALVCASTQASAEVRGTVRFGVLPLDLEASADTPLFGADVDRAVRAYNAAASAYDRMHGGRTERIDASDLGVATTLVTLSPGIELGSGAYFMRLDVPIGFGGGLRSVGLGVYPLGLQARVGKRAVIYGSLGGAASYLDRDGEGDVGALVTARGAVGVRLAPLALEVGYNALVLGGTVNTARIESMVAAGVPPADPSSAVSAGEANGLVDISLGVTF